jgi:hypothetical protein
MTGWKAPKGESFIEPKIACAIGEEDLSSPVETSERPRSFISEKATMLGITELEICMIYRSMMHPGDEQAIGRRAKHYNGPRQACRPVWDFWFGWPSAA